ncbi:Crp/Fnr family transcriptional regulator [Chryseobacterium arthrosphaerae]|uniref:Cyclic nucleotide-binding protein n=1 Tax=Chryseobacterium arthrosphaerae TaxID=651561 RepID=A0A1B8ZPG8_9FLAO|nr:Crp/Fnr family transcriptional regulator [Chryseobacterium arthrosphaerae]AYZ11626.1 Crp/Fnr family transcriptional regulator [Chryseobacterium arthrosphaerae]OCA73470.1 cyclic nucleotide-binding protein [Chryseobacterium arthrosphaerae]
MEQESEHIYAETLISYFNHIIPLNKEEINLVNDYFKPRLYRKRQYILQEGDVCKQFNFVVKGCLRTYRIDKKGNMHILQFATENWWTMDIASFHEKKPSGLNIEAVEDTVVLQINYQDLIQLYRKAGKFDRIFRVLIENAYVTLQNRLLENISSTAEERYTTFLEVYPHLLNRLPQIQIASFIGVTPEFLSRLRNKRVKNK